MPAKGSRDQVISSLREGAELRLQLIDRCVDKIICAAETIHRCLASGGKILLLGNGGSAADAQPIALEFVGWDKDYLSADEKITSRLGKR